MSILSLKLSQVAYAGIERVFVQQGSNRSDSMSASGKTVTVPLGSTDGFDTPRTNLHTLSIVLVSYQVQRDRTSNAKCRAEHQFGRSLHAQA